MIRNLPIRRKLIVVTTATAMAALAMAAAALFWFEQRAYSEKLERDLATLAQVMGIQASAVVSFGEDQAASDGASLAGETLSVLRAEPQITEAAIFLRSGRRLGTYRRDKMPVDVSQSAVPLRDGFIATNERLAYYAPIFDEREGVRVGTILLEADMKELRERVKSYGLLLSGVLGGAALVALGLSFGLQRYISVPILRLAKTTSLVTASRDYSVRVSANSSDELGQLIQGFNEMLGQIQERDRALQAAHDSLEERVHERTAELEQEVADRRRAEERIREQASLLDLAQDAIVVRDMDDVILYWNKSAERIYGWLAEDVSGSQMGRLFYTDGTRFTEAKRAVVERGEWNGELTQLTKQGREVITESRWTLLRNANGEPRSILAINTDVTEKKRLEGQFLRIQRMESIGTLAGGIAHDLNNVLAPIVMSAELLRRKTNDADIHRLVENIEVGAKRGAELVRQVLVFARGAETKRTRVQPRLVLRELYKIARETFPKSINTHASIPGDLWCISGDATQLHQVLLNLCVNARDAMPDGGELFIHAENAVVRPPLSESPEPAPHVVITVKDTGNGIPPEVREKIFEPFFTTKELGKGTGLGLSTALGIVKSHGGALDLASEVGKGTTFTVYLPADTQGVEREGEPRALILPVGHDELILLVDDEAAVRIAVGELLEASGYRVITAPDGDAALALYSERKKEISLVVTDLMMPNMDGVTLLHTLRTIRSDVRTIAASGMMTEERIHQVVRAGASAHMAKPFTSETLLQTVHRVLNSN